MDEARLQRLLAREAADCLTVLASGDQLDLGALTQSLGSVLEYLLALQLSRDPDGHRYWVDGFLVLDVTLVSETALVVVGNAWCADHKLQWKAPARASIELRAAPEPRLVSCDLRLGDASTGNLRDQQPLQDAGPVEWLFRFSVAPVGVET